MSQRFSDELTEVMGLVHELLVRKNHDYAQDGSPFSNFEGQSALLNEPTLRVYLFPLSAKIGRLNGLLQEDKTPNNESIEDTIIDIIGYSFLMLLHSRQLQTKSRIELPFS